MNECVLPILSPTAPPSLRVSWRYLTLPRGMAPHALPFRLPANSLHPSKFSSWFHEVLHSRQNWTRLTLSPLCPPVTLHTKLYHNAQLISLRLLAFPFAPSALHARSYKPHWLHGVNETYSYTRTEPEEAAEHLSMRWGSCVLFCLLILFLFQGKIVMFT